MGFGGLGCLAVPWVMESAAREIEESRLYKQDMQRAKGMSATIQLVESVR
jgi:hypothetical protein